MAGISLKQGEAKTVTLTITDINGNAVNVSAATLKFMMTYGSTTVTVLDAAFNKTQGASGIVTFVLSSTDTATYGKFKGELMITFSATNIDISEVLDVNIVQSIVS